MNRRVFLVVIFTGLLHGAARAEYKPEFNLSINVSEHTSWGRAGRGLPMQCGTKLADAFALRLIMMDSFSRASRRRSFNFCKTGLPTSPSGPRSIGPLR